MNSNTLPFCTGVILETKAKKSESQRLPPLNTDSLFFAFFCFFFAVTLRFSPSFIQNYTCTGRGEIDSYILYYLEGAN